MKLSLVQIRGMNEIQLEIFREFTSVCKELGLRYYMVHGSLLGALRVGDFMPYDDDIDVAMPRTDYEILLEKGQSLLPEPLFLQSYRSDKEFPLAFAKIRNSNTMFSQTIMRKLKVNEGIYIDIFPIDNYPINGLYQKWIKIKERFYSTRISDRLFYEGKRPIWKSVFRKLVKTVYPSWESAVKNRAELYANIKYTGSVIVVGGKRLESGIPMSWFGETAFYEFATERVSCPEKTEEYLAHIYGDYKTFDPMGKYMNDDGTVNVSAERFSLEQSYKDEVVLEIEENNNVCIR